MDTICLPVTPSSLDQAVALLRAGQVIAFPTDTVYGLAAALDDAEAIERLFAVKGRDATKAIAVLLAGPDDLPQVAEMTALAQRLAQRFWPGPLTLVVHQRPGLPANLSPTPTVGVRMPDHPDALALLRRTGPLAVTSANMSGRPSSSDALQVLAQLAGRIPLILDGGVTPGGLPSTVVDCTGAEALILREGPISAALIQAL